MISMVDFLLVDINSILGVVESGVRIWSVVSSGMEGRSSVMCTCVEDGTR